MTIPTYEEITARPIVRQTELGGRPRAGPHPWGLCRLRSHTIHASAQTVWGQPNI